MNKARTAVVAAMVSSMLLAGTTPAFADAGDQLTITSIGLTEGQAIGAGYRFHPVWTGDAEVVSVTVKAGNRGYKQTNWVNGVVVPISGVTGDTLTVTVELNGADGTILATASTTVVVDSTYPSATFTPKPGMLTSVVSGVVTITATPQSDDVAEVALVDSANQKIVTATSAPWVLTWDSRATTTGAHLTVTDRAGNTTQYGGYHADNSPPTVQGLFPVSGATAGGRVGKSATLRVTFGDAQTWVNRYAFRVDGKLVEDHQLPSGDGWYETTSGSSFGYDFGSVERTVPIEADVWDAAGNETIKSFTVVVDSTGPAATSVTPANGTLVRGSRVTGTLKATDPSGIAYADLNNYSSSLGGGKYSASVPTGRDGKLTLTWQMSDGVYNSSTVSRWVIVDNTKPVLKITSGPKSGAKVKGTVKIAASATDRNGINRVELIINGKVVAKDLKAGYAFSINTKKYGKKIRVQLRAYDKAGNATTTTTRTWHR